MLRRVLENYYHEKMPAFSPSILDSCTVCSTYICKCPSEDHLIYDLISVFSLSTEVYLYKGPEMPRARPCLPLMSRARSAGDAQTCRMSVVDIQSEALTCPL
jgi:hypothetical protein